MSTLKGVILFLSLTKAKVTKHEMNPKEKQPEFKALKDSDIPVLAGGSVNSLATSMLSKGLLA